MIYVTACDVVRLDVMSCRHAMWRYVKMYHAMAWRVMLSSAILRFAML